MDQDPSTQTAVPGDYSRDWFSIYIPEWERLLSQYKGEPAQFLEIGLFEGMCSVYTLDHILTHPESTLTGIDNFKGGEENQSVGSAILDTLLDRFKHNLGERLSRVDLRIGDSDMELLKLCAEHQEPCFDVVYVDGSHRPVDAFMDAYLSWRMLRIGGMMIFDDYAYAYRDLIYNSLVIPAEGINKFLKMATGHYEMVKEPDYQLWIRKKRVA